MNGGTILWLAAAMPVFLTASSFLRAYTIDGRIAWLAGSLALYFVGNLMMVRVMRDGGMAVAVSVSAVLQLVLSALVAVLVFGERPTNLQWAGIALGVAAVALIVWPQQAQR